MLVTPYFQSEDVVLYHGDCVELLAGIDEDCVDVVVTDPPYGVKWQSGHRKLAFDMLHGDESTEVGVVGLAASLRALRRGRHLYAFGKYDLTGCKVAGPIDIIWDKGIFSAGNLTLPWACQHETIQFYVNNKDGKLNKTLDGGLTTKLRRGSVIRCQRLNASEVQRHPTEKPIELLRQLIESSSVLHETVLDPFAGCGSTLVAARVEGRKAIGIEIDERFCEEAAKRLSQGGLW